MKPPIYSLAVLILVAQSVMAQQSGDSTFVADARKSAVRHYTQVIGVQSNLYNGSEYREYRAQGDEFPYLYDDIQFGNVLYDGEYYENIPIYYDLEKDQVITAYAHGNKVQLLKQKVEFFDISSHHFLHISNGKIAEGFYDVLYDGEMKFYAKRQKVAITKINGNDAENAFEERVKYYILKNGEYHVVKSKGSVLGLMSDKKKELKTVLRENRLKVNKNREQAIALLLKHYEETKGK